MYLYQQNHHKWYVPFIRLKTAQQIFNFINVTRITEQTYGCRLYAN